MTPRHEEKLWRPLFTGPYLSNPSSPPHKSRTLRNKISQAFQRHQDRQKPTSGATSTMRTKIDGKKETMLKFHSFPPRVGCPHAQIISNSLRFDSQVQNFKKEDTFRHDVQLSDRRVFPCQAGISIEKQPSDIRKTLRRPLFAGPYLSSPRLTSHKSTTLRKKVSQAFQGHQDRQKTSSGAMSTVRAKIDENKENVLKI